jgi:hypothetical protein
MTKSDTEPEKPQVEWFNEIPYCGGGCPYFVYKQNIGRCTLLQKELGFYDWFLAECVNPQTT